MHRGVNSAHRQSFIQQVRHGTDPSHTKRKDLMSSHRASNPPWTHLRGLFWAYWTGSTLAPTFSQSGGNICTTSEQLLFHPHINLERKNCTYSHENDCSRLTYHCPSHWQALQRHTTTRSPPNIDINTCTGLWSQLVVSHLYTGQTWDGPLTYHQDGPHELSYGKQPALNAPAWFVLGLLARGAL